MTVAALDTGPLTACLACVSMTWGQSGRPMLDKQFVMMSPVPWSAARQPGACLSAIWTPEGRLWRGLFAESREDVFLTHELTSKKDVCSTVVL